MVLLKIDLGLGQLKVGGPQILVPVNLHIKVHPKLVIELFIVLTFLNPKMVSQRLSENIQLQRNSRDSRKKSEIIKSLIF